MYHNEQGTLTLGQVIGLNNIEVQYIDGQTAVVIDRLEKYKHIYAHKTDLGQGQLVIIGYEDFVLGDVDSELNALHVFDQKSVLVPSDTVVGNFYVTDLDGEQYSIQVVELLSANRLHQVICHAN